MLQSSYTSSKKKALIVFLLFFVINFLNLRAAEAITDSQTPTITSPLTATANVGLLFNYQITVSADFYSFNAFGLPSGLTVDNITGQISGIPVSSGSSSITLMAYPSSGSGSVATATLVLAIRSSSPVITSAREISGIIGTVFNYQITATNSPTSFSATGLPAGLTVNTVTGLISGTPSVSAISNLSIAASNSEGSGTADVTLNISAPAPVTAPVITSPTTASGQVGIKFTYQITATNRPFRFSASAALPEGLLVDATSGFISGTPTTPGTYNFLIKANNNDGSGIANLTLIIKPSSLESTPVITSSTSAAGKLGVPFSYQITATNNPTSFEAELPLINSGLSIDQKTGIISGIPTIFGNLNIKISAAHEFGSNAGTADLSLSLSGNRQIPMVISPAAASGSAGKPFSYQIMATNNPTSFAANFHRPPSANNNGFSINAQTGLISGPASLNENISVDVQATNSAGTGTARIFFFVKDPEIPVVINSPAVAEAIAGESFSYEVTTSSNSTSMNAAGLPPGLSFTTIEKTDPTTRTKITSGLISGTPTTSGSFNIGLSASNFNNVGSIAEVKLLIFGEQAAAPLQDGTLVNDRGTIFIIENGLKRGFTSLSAFIKSGHKLSSVIEADTSNITVGEVISEAAQRHPRGTVVVSQGIVYFLGKDLRYPFPSEEVFLSWGNKFKDVVPANSADLAMPIGQVVSIKM